MSYFGASYFAATLRSLYATLGQTLTRPSTVEYPRVVRPRAERIRASFALLKDAEGDEACIGCRKCEKVCPSEVIAMTTSKRPSPVSGKARGYADDFTLNLQACIICELCVQVCPTDAIVMTKEQEAPGFCREDLVLTMDRLYRNGEKRERRAWSTASILEAQQKPAEKPGDKKVAATPTAESKPVVETKPAGESKPAAGAADGTTPAVAAPLKEAP